MSDKLNQNRRKGEKFLEEISWGFWRSIIANYRIEHFKVTTAVSVVYIFFIIILNRYLINEMWTILALAIGLFTIITPFALSSIQEIIKDKVILYPSSYNWKGTSIAVTAYNIGNATAIREIGLILGWIEYTSGILGLKRRLKGWPTFGFDVIAYEMLATGCFPLANGDVHPIPEEPIKSIIRTWEKNPKFSDILEINPNVYLVMFDRYRGEEIVAHSKSLNGLVSACKLGDIKGLLETIMKENSIKLGKLYVKPLTHAKNANDKEVPHFAFLRDYPPIMTTNERILYALEIIEKKIEALRSEKEPYKNQKITKNRKT